MPSEIVKFNSYFTIPELRNLKSCAPEERTHGLYLEASDLKLDEWLFDSVTAGDTKNVNFNEDTATGPLKQNVISQEVKFEVLTSGNVTPGWKLRRVSVNQNGSLLAISRDRTHDLIVTFGPTDTTVPAGKDARPGADAASAQQSLDFGSSVAAQIRNALQP